MNFLYQLFIASYEGALWYNVALEFIAALLGVLSVFYAKKENILVFPTGILSTGIYVYLLSQWQLYGDLIINSYYTLMSIYGWWMWSRFVDDEARHIAITRSTKPDLIKAGAIFLLTSLFVIAVYRYYNVMPNTLDFTESLHYFYRNFSSGKLSDFRKITPFLDTFTTGAAFAAMWLMANKKLENWAFWIAVNVVSVPLYVVKGYGFTAIQYSIFLVLAILGRRAWLLNLKNTAHA